MKPLPPVKSTFILEKLFIKDEVKSGQEREMSIIACQNEDTITEISNPDGLQNDVTEVIDAKLRPGRIQPWGPCKTQMTGPESSHSQSTQ